MYRNAVYLPNEQLVRVYTWDDRGNRISYDHAYEPYICLETNTNAALTSIYNTGLKKVSFRNHYDRNKYIKHNRVTRLFENLPATQQFLVDTYWEHSESAEMTAHPIRVVFVDIETYSPDSFPIPDEASHAINVITVYDSLSEKFTTWGLGRDYKPSNNNVTYIRCDTEVELLEKFIEYFQDDAPDILSGYNSEFFDIPYLINRINNILGEDTANKLSPVGRVYFRTILGKFGKEQKRYHIDGIACIDYLDIYKRFCMSMRESYKLDAIGEIELGEKKVDYGNQNLAQLSDSDWQTFVDYNIQDVNLLIRLEQKLKYLELLRMLAYAGCTTFESALGSLSIITGLCAIKARHKEMRIPTFIRDAGDGKNEGAYVGEPQKNFQEHIISFDANSLYPNVMITLNLSPETKIGKIVSKSEKEIVIRHVNGEVYRLSPSNFLKFINKEEISISKAQVLFSQKKKGIVPEIVDSYYQKRVDIKDGLKKLKHKQLKVEKDSQEYKELQTKIDQLNIHQFTIKILINSIYGYFGNKQSSLGDDDIARSITLTGQAVIKQSNELLIEYIKKRGNVTDDDIRKKSPIIYNDTDSSYVSIKQLVDNLDIKLKDSNNNITKDYYQLVQDIEDHLNTCIKDWGSKVLRSKDCRLTFKREAIADVGLFLQKKRYVIHVLDDEGIPCDKFKYTGVEVVRTTMPKPVKPYVKKIIETMLMTQSQSKTNEVFSETYETFKNLPIEDIAFVMGIKGYDKYADISTGFTPAKGTPIHVKAAYYYNKLLEKYDIVNQYETLSSGDKVRYFYLKTPNKFGMSAIGYKYYLPTEFKDFIVPDKEKMFEKIVYSVIERFYTAVGWKLKAPTMTSQTDLFELLRV